jgi:hypothetical protein
MNKNTVIEDLIDAPIRFSQSHSSEYAHLLCRQLEGTEKSRETSV